MYSKKKIKIFIFHNKIQKNSYLINIGDLLLIDK